MRAALSAGELGGWVQGAGSPVLLLHGGPGLSYEYLDGLADEIGPGYRVAAYQQRGLAPSTVEGPFDVATAIADALAVLDALGWERALAVGHSFGGHLVLHLAVAAPARLLGGLCVDTLGGVGDGGSARFVAELDARTPEADRARAADLGESEEGFAEIMRLFWPAYFAARDDTLPWVPTAFSGPAYSGLVESRKAEMAALEAALGSITVPLGFVAGAASPMPAEEASVATARAIPGAWAEVVEGAGHFVWHERPGRVRAALDRLSRARTGP